MTDAVIASCQLCGLPVSAVGVLKAKLLAFAGLLVPATIIKFRIQRLHCTSGAHAL